MAEFIEIIKIQSRMCKKNNCYKCPTGPDSNGHDVSCSEFRLNYPEEFERVCLDWAKENPEITNADKLYQIVEEVFGEEIAMSIKSRAIETAYKCGYIECPNTRCEECPNIGFWNKPYVEPRRVSK